MSASWVCLFVLVGATLVPHWLPGLRAGHDKPIFFVIGLAVAVVLVLLHGVSAFPPSGQQPRATATPLAQPRR